MNAVLPLVSVEACACSRITAWSLSTSTIADPSGRRASSSAARAGFREVPGSADFPGIVEGVDICMEMIPSHSGAKENRLA